MTTPADAEATVAADFGHEAGSGPLGGRYVLGERLGAGGMGVVYQAHDAMLQRTVAVKIFSDGASEVARTTAETRILASLNHGSLVTLYDAHVGGTPPSYLVMELVDGPTLRERLETGPIPPPVVAGMARDLADALHVVHAAGIVHRDIKPSNVLLRSSTVPGEEFRAKLADFGIAHLIDSTRLTTSGSVIGSAAYLSPEQVKGADPAPASDIYALGLLLLESLTGRRAFAQQTAHETALARLTQDPSIPETVGARWRDLLEAMTAREPERRPSALDVVVAARGLDDATTATSDSTREQKTLRLDVDSVNAPARPRRLQRWIWPRVAPVAVLAGIAGIAIWASSATGSVPPTLPTLEEPLHSHMQQLLDSVSP